ncbi:MAG TPA: pyridoxamine 5'-phosphate oxidase family protein [Thermomicrobiales bacterium]|jgi:hypothetical protein|nr:pyridoxamine 5'-phosphate oxidase family protein [Thermomicrobiales bacterium]
MHETADDLIRLQDLLDRGAAGASPHMASIFTADRRLSASELAARLTGMRLLTLATVTAKGEPRTAPVDGLFYQGHFWFGSAPEAVKFRHIRARPAVSATHLPGESFAVIVHGTCHLVDIRSDEMAGLRSYCREVYGPDWEDFGLPAQYARIDADRMYTYALPDPTHAGEDGR